MELFQCIKHCSINVIIIHFKIVFFPRNALFLSLLSWCCYFFCVYLCYDYVQQTFILVRTCSRRLYHVFNIIFFCLLRHHQDTFKTSSRRVWRTSSSKSLEEDVLKPNHFLKTSLEDVLRTFRKMRNCYVEDVSTRCLENVFNTFWSRWIIRFLQTCSWTLQDVLQRALQDVFKTSLKSLQDVFKMSSRNFRDVLRINWSC